MKKLGQISLPQNFSDEYSRRTAVMLYQYLGEMRLVINQLIDEIMATNYATRYDQDSSTPTYAYLGKAVVGADPSSSVWQIQKLTFGVDGDVQITWADGNASFDNVWDDRASLTYS